LQSARHLAQSNRVSASVVKIWLDVSRVGSAFLTRLFDHVCNELTSIVAANIFWRAPYRGQLVKHPNNIGRLQFTEDFKRNIFPRVYI
jgi:hypothetical protein